MFLRISSRLSTLTQRLFADERGAVLIYVTLMLPVLVGFALLAVDASRLFNLSTHLQKGADALALAGAAELDLKPDAITRADAAIANMVANQHKFSNAGTVNVAVASKRYFKKLPDSDANALASATVTDKPEEARYVEVTVTTQTLTTLMPATFLGASSNTATSAARAVAGHNTAVCKFTPMFICNPWEGNLSIWEALKDPAERRKQIKMQLGTGGADQYFPGNYGWLDSPSLGNGANALQEALGKVNPPTCFVQNGVSQKTGNITPADSAINTRFDMWDQGFKGEKGNPDYRPAQNVRKGYDPTAPACNASMPKDTASTENPKPIAYANTNMLGRDSAFPDAGGRLGNGNWNFEGYWSSTFGTPPPSGWSNANSPSRYDVYRHEIANNLIDQPAASGAAKGEKGTPACYSGGGLSDDPDRRVIYGAIIDCNALSVHGNSGDPLPVTAFGKFFLTEPVCPNNEKNALGEPACGGQGTIWTELIGVVEPGTVANDVARDIVQLYR